MAIPLRVDGRDVTVSDDSRSLLDALREELGARAPKDGCSPQGQCGCCTVWVDGSPRVSCVTPVRRVAGKDVTTSEGLDDGVARRWADALVATGGSQCGFCTPGIVMRLAALGEHQRSGRRRVDETAIRTSLAAHLCRCTGWQSIVEAAGAVLGVPVGPGGDDRPPVPDGLAGDTPESALTGAPARPGAPPRDPLLAAWRAQLEGPAFQATSALTALGQAGFAEDTAPSGALVAVPRADGSLALGADLTDARRKAGKVQGRNSPAGLRHPLELPEGDWEVCLRTTWLEPAYLEPDASWCRPSGRPATPLANGGAFGGKRRSPVPADARRLADSEGTAVRVVWSREDVARFGPKRPPVAIGIRADGTGVLRLARTPRSTGLDVVARRVAQAVPGLRVDVVDVPGPPVSADVRGAGWVEATAVAAALGALRAGGAVPGMPVTVAAPGGGRATVSVSPEGPVYVEVWAGEVLDRAVLRSYCMGAVHQALGWVRTEGIAVDDDGAVRDLTVRSCGVLSARDTPWMHVTLHTEDRWPVNGSDAVMAAAAAAAWITDGLAPAWPTRRTGAAR